MNNRDRFVNLFLGKEVDRVPFLDYMGVQTSALARWEAEGLEVRVGETPYEAFAREIGFDGARGVMLWMETFIYPHYASETISNDGRHILRRNHWGATVRDIVGSEVMPIAVEGPVKGRDTWQEVKRHLLSETPGRLPANWNEIVAKAKRSGETVYMGDLPCGFFGGVRELMTFEEQAVLFYDDPELMEDILDTLCDLWIGLIRLVSQHITLDWYFIWEDMCYKSGPLISPDLCRRFLLPRYKRLIQAVRETGCPLVLLDSDGDQRPLTDLWMEGGVDILMPWESQFGLDITEVRDRWPQLGMIGGISEAALEGGRGAIDRQLERMPRMLSMGRYIPSVDHNITANVSWDNVRYFYEGLRNAIEMNRP